MRATKPSKRPRVLLVEDEVHTRERIARAVRERPELELAAAVGSCAEARAELARAIPDVMLADLGLPDGDGRVLIREVHQLAPATAIMVITVFGDEEHVVGALEAGATGYLLKDRAPEDIGSAILELVAGGSPISAGVARHLLKRFQAADAPAADAAEPRPHLSEREQEILRLVMKGFRFHEIAGLLGVSEHTVKTHVRRIYEKLQVSSRSEAVYEALQLGLVKADD